MDGTGAFDGVCVFTFISTFRIYTFKMFAAPLYADVRLRSLRIYADLFYIVHVTYLRFTLMCCFDFSFFVLVCFRNVCF